MLHKFPVLLKQTKAIQNFIQILSNFKISNKKWIKNEDGPIMPIKKIY